VSSSNAAAPTALAIDRTADLVAVGLRSGQLSLRTAANVGTSGSSLAFFGHRGPITAAALNAGHGLAATGGSDGIVRLWDVASGAPTGVVMQPAAAAIAMLALSADARWVASAAERVVRVAEVASGTVVAEIPLAGRVTALAFVPDASAIAIGDDAGNVLLVPVDVQRPRWEIELGSAVTALALAPSGERLAVGDAAGGVRFVRAVDGTASGEVRTLPQPIRWLDFDTDGAELLVATDAWLHALSAPSPSLEPLHSRLVGRPVRGDAFAAGAGAMLRLAGRDLGGAVEVVARDLAVAPGAPNAAALVAADWPAALALRLDDNGEPVPFDP
jgi:hypothetical protein